MKTLERPRETKTLPKKELNTIKTPPSKLNKYDYDNKWLNKELKGQIDTLKAHPNIITQIELYELMEYSKAQFDYRMGKNGNTPYTQNLIKKRDEILEARLVKKGLNSTNYGFVIFLLKNHYGYTDKKEVESNNNFVFNVTRGTISSVGKGRKQIKATTTPVIPPKQTSQNE